MKRNTPYELAVFDTLPDSAHIDVHTVAALFGCQTSTVWARLRRQQIPEPRRFGGHTRWRVGDIRKALSHSA